MTKFKSVHLFLLGILLVTLTQGCSTQTRTEDEQDTEIDSINLSSPSPQDLNSNQSELLQTIIGNSTGIVRGIQFGDPIKKVKANENFDMFEDTTDHVGFTFDTEQLETIDVQYFYHMNVGVHKINIDVYLNSKDATRQLWKASKEHFMLKYNTPQQEDDKKIVWKDGNVLITLDDVSIGKDFGVKMSFVPVDKSLVKLHE
jgi:hypothetical protein